MMPPFPEGLESLCGHKWGDANRRGMSGPSFGIAKPPDKAVSSFALLPVKWALPAPECSHLHCGIGPDPVRGLGELLAMSRGLCGCSSSQDAWCSGKTSALGCMAAARDSSLGVHTTSGPRTAQAARRGLARLFSSSMVWKKVHLGTYRRRKGCVCLIPLSCCPLIAAAE